MTPTEAGVPRPAPSAADLAALVRGRIVDIIAPGSGSRASDALDALLARCEEAEENRNQWHSASNENQERAEEAERLTTAANDFRWRETYRARAAEARVAELEAALNGFFWLDNNRDHYGGSQWLIYFDAAITDARAALASPQETTT